MALVSMPFSNNTVLAKLIAVIWKHGDIAEKKTDGSRNASSRDDKTG